MYFFFPVSRYVIINVRRIPPASPPVMDAGSNLHFGLSVFNLTDGAGLTEGNPRAGGAATGDFIVGRPILPKTTYFRVTYNF